jgi:hypothetical protein
MYSDYRKITLGITGTILTAALIGLMAWFMVSSIASADSGYTFTVSGNISFGDMFPRDTPFVGNTNNSLSGDNPAGYTVTAVDTKTPNKGCMVSGENALHDKFKIGTTALTLETADVSRTLLSTSGPGTNSVPLFVSQKISYNDAVANGYAITITYTVVSK